MTRIINCTPVPLSIGGCPVWSFLVDQEAEWADPVSLPEAAQAVVRVVGRGRFDSADYYGKMLGCGPAILVEARLSPERAAATAWHELGHALLLHADPGGAGWHGCEGSATLTGHLLAQIDSLSRLVRACRRFPLTYNYSVGQFFVRQLVVSGSDEHWRTHVRAHFGFAEQDGVIAAAEQLLQTGARAAFDQRSLALLVNGNFATSAMLRGVYDEMAAVMFWLCVTSVSTFWYQPGPTCAVRSLLLSLAEAEPAYGSQIRALFDARSDPTEVDE